MHHILSKYNVLLYVVVGVDPKVVEKTIADKFVNDVYDVFFCANLFCDNNILLQKRIAQRYASYIK